MDKKGADAVRAFFDLYEQGANTIDLEIHFEGAPHSGVLLRVYV